MIYIVLIVSFILESIFTNILNINSMFIPLFLLIAFINIYPLYKSKNNYIISSAIIGMFYDIVFTNSLFIYTLTYILISLIVIKIYSYITNNILNYTFLSIIIIVFYRFISFILIKIISVNALDYNTLFLFIKNSLISNIIYNFILYNILKYILKKLNKKVYE